MRIGCVLFRCSDLRDNNPSIYQHAAAIEKNGRDENCNKKDLTSDIAEESLYPIDIYPNPTDDFLNMNLRNIYGSIEIYNTNGKRVFKKKVKEYIA